MRFRYEEELTCVNGSQHQVTDEAEKWRDGDEANVVQVDGTASMAGTLAASCSFIPAVKWQCCVSSQCDTVYGCWSLRVNSERLRNPCASLTSMDHTQWRGVREVEGILNMRAQDKLSWPESGRRC